MTEMKRFYVGDGPRLIEMTAAYAQETGFRGLVKGEDVDQLESELHQTQVQLHEARNARNTALRRNAELGVDFSRCQQQRDDLLAALEALLEHEGTVDVTGIGELPSEALLQARAQAEATIAAVKASPAPAPNSTVAEPVSP